ncbi:MAG: RIP metalloprotease RseP [Puniceicoccaceae bacterium]
MTGLFSNLVGFGYVLLAVFLLGFCIFIHELGHFLAARRRGLKVERFSIGFGPPIVRWERNGVDYRISWIPFGGYVALPQLADMGRLEGAGEEEAAGRLPPIGYADKMIVAAMGAVFNMIFALFLSCILWIVGQEVIVSTEIDVVERELRAADGSLVPGPAFAAGLRPGDEIVAVDGDRVGDWMQVHNAILTGTGREDGGVPATRIDVLRDGQPMSFEVTPVLTSRESIRDIGIGPDSDLVVSGLVEGMPAAEAGMRPGDVLAAIDGEPIRTSALLQVALSRHEDGPVEITVLRDGEPVALSVEPVYVPEADAKRFGFVYGYQPKTEIVHRNPAEQIALMVDTIKRTLVALFHQGSDVKVRNLNGPVGIVHVLSTVGSYGLTHLIWLLAFINVNLAILNLLPIPVLDGGHMLFATIAKVAGRPLPRRFLEVTQGAFVVLFLTFMLYVTFFDVGRIGHQFGFGDDAPAAAEEEPPPSAGNEDAGPANDP